VIGLSKQQTKGPSPTIVKLNLLFAPKVILDLACEVISDRLEVIEISAKHCGRNMLLGGTVLANIVNCDNKIKSQNVYILDYQYYHGGHD